MASGVSPRWYVYPMTAREVRGMAPVVGDSIITATSGIVGTILEVVENRTGSWRVRIAHDGGEKWTTVKP